MTLSVAENRSRDVSALSPGRVAFNVFCRRKAAVTGLAIIIFFVAIAVLSPVIAPYDPLMTSWSAVRQAPSFAHWMGTDELGRDVVSRMMYGSRASLAAGVFAVSLGVLVGVPIGVVAGFAGGIVDAVLGRVIDAMLACPSLVLAIAFAAFLGPSLENAVIAIGLTTSPIFARIARGATMDAATNEYVEAARSIGTRPWRIAVRHILPNILPPILVQSSLAIAHAIIAEASLSFIGLGQQPPQPSWGSMLGTAQEFLEQAPWLALCPGVAIFIAVLAFNMIGDGLSDALDPRQR